jgi:hypothetical protein
MPKPLLEIGEKRYYMHSEVTVTKVWENFHLAEIKGSNNEQLFYVDICTLTLEASMACSLSLGLFGEDKYECSTIY